jgi:hypothetical protein
MENITSSLEEFGSESTPKALFLLEYTRSPDEMPFEMLHVLENAVYQAAAFLCGQPHS